MPKNETWVDEYLRMIDDCEKRESRLTDWERSFVDSLRTWLEQDDPKPLSAKQINAMGVRHG